jgi:hypothetical protein
LDRILCLGVVAKDPACDSKYERGMTLEEDRQGVGLIGEEIGNEIFVALQAKSHIPKQRIADS